MTRTLKALLIGSMLAAAGGAAADAKTLSNDAARGLHPPARVPHALDGILATSKTRIAALVTPDFRTGPVVRGKGLTSVSHPSTGAYCITPKVPVNVHALVPVVSVEWGTSLGNSNLVQYHDINSFCPANEIEVLTFSFDRVGGSFDFADTVAFTIVVP